MSEFFGLDDNSSSKVRVGKEENHVATQMKAFDQFSLSCGAAYYAVQGGSTF